MNQNSLIWNYQELFLEWRVIFPVKTDSGLTITLEEGDKSAKLKEVAIVGVPNKSILLSLHGINLGNTMKNTMKLNQGIATCCDYVLVSETKKEIVLLFIELKSKEPNVAHVKKQLKSASCLLEYCNAIIKYFSDYSLPDSRRIKTYYVLFSHKKGSNKMRTGIKAKNNHDPDRFYHHKFGDDKSASVQYAKLL